MEPSVLLSRANLAIARAQALRCLRSNSKWHRDRLRAAANDLMLSDVKIPAVAARVNAGGCRRSRCHWARIRSGMASPSGRLPGERGTGACSSRRSACGRVGIAHSSGPGWVPLSPASPWRAWPGRSKGRPAHCGKLSEIAQFGSMSAPGDGAFSKCHYMNLDTANRTARHANTHTRPRYHHPRGRSGHGGERAGSQYEPGSFNSATIESTAEFAQPRAQRQCLAKPDTLAVAAAFAGAGDRRTALATAPLGGGGAGRTAFRVRILAGPFRFPSAVGIPMGMGTYAVR